MSSSGSIEVEPEGSSAPGVDRRTMLLGAAAGAAAVWVAPAILSVDAASAATCVSQTLAWSTQEVNVDNLDTSSFTVNYGTGGVLTVDYDDTTAPAPPTATPGYATVTPLGGETADFITLEMDASATGQLVTLTFDFSTAVRFLTFTLLDVDLGTGNWQDEVTLSASLLGSPVTLAPGDITFNSTFVSSTVVGTDNRFTGILDPSGVGTGVPNNTTDANVSVTYPTLVDSVTITYRAVGGGPDPQPQQVGVGSLTFCAN
jgi:hypothetical protein